MPYRLAVLQETVRFDLGEYESRAPDGTPSGLHPFAGVTAVCRPLDLEGLAQWHDAFPDDATRNVAALTCVRQQLVALEGMAMVAPDGSEGPFDAANPLHFRSLEVEMVGAIYARLLRRTALSEAQEKNSGLPSASDGTRSSAPSPAGAAP